MNEQDEPNEPNDKATQLLFVEEVAERLRISVSTVYRWIREGRLPVIRLSANTLRIDPADLERFIMARRMKSVLSRTRGRSWQVFVREGTKAGIV